MGSVAFDAIETPFGKTDKIVGGAGTYAGISASYMFDKVKLIGVVGEDFGEENLNLFKERKINTEGVEIVKGGKSFFWSGKYHNDMNTRDTLVTELNVLADFDPKIPTSYQDCEYLLLANLTPQVQLDALSRLAHRPKLVVMDTMNFWIDTAYDDLKKIIKKVDVIAINDSEARQLTDEYSLVKAAAAIQKMGPKYVVIKKGEHGALLFGENQVFSAPALPLAEVFDPTGAGDVFAGAFIGYLAHVQSLSFNNMKNATIYGSAMASFCVEKFGVERLMELTQEDIHDRIKSFISLSKFDM